MKGWERKGRDGRNYLQCQITMFFFDSKFDLQFKSAFKDNIVHKGACPIITRISHIS